MHCSENVNHLCSAKSAENNGQYTLFAISYPNDAEILVVRKETLCSACQCKNICITIFF